MIIGESASLSKTIAESDIYTYATLVGDLNPVHLDPEKAKKSIFGERIAHGMLVGGLISAVIGMQLPGEGTIYMEQDLKFLSPVKIGDTVTAVVEVAEVLNEKKRIVKLNTKVINQNGQEVIAGYAVVKAP